MNKVSDFMDRVKFNQAKNMPLRFKVSFGITMENKTWWEAPTKVKGRFATIDFINAFNVAAVVMKSMVQKCLELPARQPEVDERGVPVQMNVPSAIIETLGQTLDLIIAQTNMLAALVKTEEQPIIELLPGTELN